MSRACSPVEDAGPIAAPDRAADGVVITGADGVIQYANPAFTVPATWLAVDGRGRIAE
ncbi:MAG: hypothetical protein WBE72_13675 [Terracidiphilus sp.]